MTITLKRENAFITYLSERLNNNKNISYMTVVQKKQQENSLIQDKHDNRISMNENGIHDKRITRLNE